MEAKRKISIDYKYHVLVVEDSSQRAQWFASRLGPNTRIADTPTNAIIAFSNAQVTGIPYDVIFLDHDCMDGKEDNFRRVAVVISVSGFKGVVIIHSMSPVGAPWMKALLDEVHIENYTAPFGTFDLGRYDSTSVKPGLMSCCIGDR